MNSIQKRLPLMDASMSEAGSNHQSADLLNATESRLRPRTKCSTASREAKSSIQGIAPAVRRAFDATAHCLEIAKRTFLSVLDFPRQRAKYLALAQQLTSEDESYGSTVKALTWNATS